MNSHEATEQPRYELSGVAFRIAMPMGEIGVLLRINVLNEGVVLRAAPNPDELLLRFFQITF